MRVSSLGGLLVSQNNLFAENIETDGERITSS